MPGRRHATEDPRGIMDVNIVRPAVPGDGGPIAEIFDHFVLNTNVTFETAPRPPSDWSARIKSAEASSHPFIVAATDGRVVGYAYADVWRSTAAYRFTVENTVYVHPDFTGHGLGRLLLTKLIARCTEAGFRRMIAVIADVGNPASVGLHESLGFVEVGTLTGVGFKHDQWIDTILMQHELTPNS